MSGCYGCAKASFSPWRHIFIALVARAQAALMIPRGSSSLGVAQHQNHRIPAEEHLADEAVLARVSHLETSCCAGWHLLAFEVESHP